MLFTEFGIDTLVMSCKPVGSVVVQPSAYINLVILQLLKAVLDILCIDAGIVKVFNALHLKNALLPKLTTESPISIDDMPVQPEKAPVIIFVTELGSTTDVSLLQSKNV